VRAKKNKIRRPNRLLDPHRVVREPKPPPLTLPALTLRIVLVLVLVLVLPVVVALIFASRYL
jgi:hypothetical protein